MALSTVQWGGSQAGSSQAASGVEDGEDWLVPQGRGDAG